jgi:peptidoglycan biosynthesis protein MviN/MurJ (putative lipid II flippase)
LLFVLAAETDDWFSWTIQPPLTAAFLGASYWAAAVLFWWTLRRDDPRRATAALLPVTLIGVLLLIATLIHWDRFHDDLFGWFWRVAYLAVPVALAVGAFPALRAARGRDRRARSPLPGPLRSLLALQRAP